MSKGGELLKNTLILALGSFAAQLVGFILLPVYTRYLSTTDFGLVDLVTVILTLALPILTVQIHLAAFRFLIDARGDEVQQSRIITNAVFVLMGLVTLWLAVCSGVAFIWNIPDFWLIVLTGVCMLALNNASQISRGLGDNLRFSIANSVTALVTLGLGIYFVAFARWGTTGVWTALLLANGSSALYLIMRLRIYSYFAPACRDWALCKSMLRYSVPLIPNGLAWWINNAADRVIISLMMGTGANGVYAASAKFVTVLNAPNSVFTQSWSESASLHIHSEDRNKFFSAVANAAIRLFFTMGLGLIALMPFIFTIVVDSSYIEGLRFIPVLILGVCFNVVAGVYDGVYIAKMLSRKLMFTTALAAVLNIALNLAFVPWLGLFGAALGTTLAFVILTFVRAWDTRKYVEICLDKQLCVLVAMEAAIVLTCYYSQHQWAQLGGLAVATITAFALNARFIGSAINGIKNRIAPSA